MHRALDAHEPIATRDHQPNGTQMNKRSGRGILQHIHRQRMCPAAKGYLPVLTAYPNS